MERECEKRYLYWLCQIPAFGAMTIRNLWQAFDSLEEVYNIEGNRLMEKGLLRKKDVSGFDFSKQNFSKYMEGYERLKEREIRFITPLDEEYPKRLRDLYDFPMGLYIRGGLPEDTRPTVAIVGARSCSQYGKQMAETISAELSRNGIQIISGLAEGIDGAAHWGAIGEKGKTYGILGCGVNICYPSAHYSLFEAMINSGGIISEYPMGSRPLAWHFPLRNRIISALADVILVIEARKRSGSLITVDLGLELGREIFAMPGRPGDPLGEGCNQLIQSGANLFMDVSEVLGYFGINHQRKLKVDENPANRLAKNEKMLYSCLDLQPKHMEELVNESKLSVTECIKSLLELETGGYILRVDSQYYRKRI